MNTPTGVYSVELLYARDPEIDAARLLGALRARLGSIERIAGLSDSLAYVAQDVGVDFEDWRTSAQIVISPPTPYSPGHAASSLEHTWDWPGARAAVAQASRSVIVSDFLARSMSPAARLRLVGEAVRAVVGVAVPLAIDWKPAQKIVDPTSSGLSAATTPFNVRYFTFAGDTGRALMDTRGLDALGLPDVQCSFTGISPSDIASNLYGIAATLVSDGPIADGHVAAAKDGRRWICRVGSASVPPVREVLELQVQVGSPSPSKARQPSGQGSGQGSGRQAGSQTAQQGAQQGAQQEPPSAEQSRVKPAEQAGAQDAEQTGAQPVEQAAKQAASRPAPTHV